MRRRTSAAVAVVLLALAGAAVGGLAQTDRFDDGPTVMWVSDTAREVGGNHHAPAVGTADGETLVYAPVSGRADTERCALVALEATTGVPRWRSRVPAPDCTIHSVADPTVADYDRDGVEEVLAATTEERLVGHDPSSGAVEFEHELGSYGYTAPVVADVTGDGRSEVVVVDVRGTVAAVRSDGTAVWTRRLDSYTWAQPAAADFDGDGRTEVAVSTGDAGHLHLFEHDGTPAWEAPTAFDSSVTWMTTVRGDDDAEIVVATARGGTVAAVDGNGSVAWERDLGSFAAVEAVADGDDDGGQEVYAVTDDGTLHALAASDGRTEWETTLTNADVQMTPPPAVGDVDGDGSVELVAPTNDGIVALVDPRDGEITATYEREDAIYAPPTLADLDGDGSPEALVMYGRGRVVALDFGEH